MHPDPRCCPHCGRPALPLIDRVRLALARHPSATLGRVLWLTGSRDVSMVATMMRMVHLAARRGTVTASPTTPPHPDHSTVSAPLVLPGSLPASTHVARDGHA